MKLLKRFLINRKLKKYIKNQRKNQILEVKKTMKKIYNPIYFKTKPKYNKDMTSQNIISIYDSVKTVYNPSRKNEYSDIIDIDKKSLAKT